MMLLHNIEHLSFSQAGGRYHFRLVLVPYLTRLGEVLSILNLKEMLTSVVGIFYPTYLGFYPPL